MSSPTHDSNHGHHAGQVPHSGHALHPGPAPLETRPFDPLPLAPAVVFGWLAFDLASYGMQGSPQQAVLLLPGALVAFLLGCIAGRLWQEWPQFMPLLTVLALIASLATFLVDLPIPAEARWLPRVVFAQGLLLLVLRRLSAQRWLPLTSLACAGGALLSIALAWLLEVRAGASLSLDLAVQLTLAAALITILSCFPARTRSLPVGALAGVLWLGAVLFFGRDATALRRADQNTPLQADRERPNLLMVVLDTVRADHLGSYGYRRNTTPKLDRWVTSQATRYANSNSTSSWTLPSHASLFTGLFPDEHGATRPRPEDAAGLDLQAWPACALRPDVTPLAERLTAQGFHTAAIVANITFLRHEFGLDRGFARYDDRLSTYLPKRIALAQMTGKTLHLGALPYRRARTISDIALGWIAEHFEAHAEVPFFLMLNYMDAHAPQVPPAPFKHAFEEPLPNFEPGPAGAAQRARYFDELAYDRGLAYADDQLNRVLADLDARGQLEHTVVVLTSDHGEAFGEHGYWLHGWNLHAETVSVPLLIKPAEASPKARVEATPVTGADVMNLSLEALGLPRVELRAAEAEHLAAGMLGQLYMTEHLIEKFAAKGWPNPGLRQMAWLEGPRKFLVSDAAPVQAYDLLADPEELQPLELNAPERAAAEAKAKAWWLAHPPLQVRGAALSEEDRDRLGDLGYMGEDED